MGWIADSRGWLSAAVTTPGLTSAFFLVLFVHVWISLGVGRFAAARTTTWLMLIVGGTLVQAMVFLGYVLPWGQAAYWLATLPHPAWLETAIAAWPSGTDSVDVAAFAVLAADMAVAYFGLWRTRRASAVLFRVVVVALLAIIVDAIVVAAAPAPSADLLITPARLLPAWYAQPIYAMLRSVPDKLAGVALATAACLIPAIWPWARRPRRGPFAVPWWALWVGLAVVWTGLGAIGSGPPGRYPAATVWGLAACYFAFFLLPPPLLKAGARGETSG